MSKQIPQVEISDKFNFFTSIWIVPFIALIIAGWLAYQYFSELGPQIRIVFPENAGLQAGQSHIKYRNVPVGMVKKIELQKDGEGIVVIARMEKTVAPFLNDSSKFWIVKPEVGIGGVSGLDTLISGTYINMNAVKAEEPQDIFVGDMHPYRDDTQGEYFVLNSPHGNNAVKTGTPIYLKNIKVGQVEYVVLALDNASVDVIVYIENRFTPYLRSDSNFWVRSTFGVSLNNGRMDLAVAPVTDLIQGAIEFSSEKKGITCNVPDAHIFKLYPNKGEIENTFIGSSQKQVEDFKIYTQESIAKLHIGSSVRYEGFEVGKVKGIKIYYEKQTHLMHSEIIVSLNLSVFANADDSTASTGKKNFKEAIEEGLRAEIIPSDPITGFLYVNFMFLDVDNNQTMEHKDAFNIIPSVRSKSGDIVASMSKILDKINDLPLENLVVSLNTMISNAGAVVKGVDEPLITVLTDLKTTIKNLNKMTNKKTFSTMPDEFTKTFRELTKTLQTTKKVVKGYDGNSLIVRQLSQTLNIVNQTSKEMQFFLKMLNRKPNSLIFGDK